MFSTCVLTLIMPHAWILQNKQHADDYLLDLRFIDQTRCLKLLIWDFHPLWTLEFNVLREVRGERPDDDQEVFQTDRKSVVIETTALYRSAEQKSISEPEKP